MHGNRHQPGRQRRGGESGGVDLAAIRIRFGSRARNNLLSCVTVSRHIMSIRPGDAAQGFAKPLDEKKGGGVSLWLVRVWVKMQDMLISEGKNRPVCV